MNTKLLRGLNPLRLASRVFNHCRPALAVGTLGDPLYPGLTCSESSAWALFSRKNVTAFESFESAAAAMIQGKIDRVLVPGAYRRPDVFIHDIRLEIDMIELVQIPSIVVAGVSLTPPCVVEDLFLHPSTESLIPKTPFSVVNHTTCVNSNIAACLAVVQSNQKTASCITNEKCARHFGLTIYMELRHKPWDPFYVFKARR